MAGNSPATTPVPGGTPGSSRRSDGTPASAERVAAVVQRSRNPGMEIGTVLAMASPAGNLQTEEGLATLEHELPEIYAAVHGNGPT